MATSKNTTNGRKEHRKGRCVDCRHSEPLGDFSVMCKVLKVGKAKSSLRICEHYEAK